MYLKFYKLFASIKAQMAINLGRNPSRKRLSNQSIERRKNCVVQHFYLVLFCATPIVLHDKCFFCLTVRWPGIRRKLNLPSSTTPATGESSPILSMPKCRRKTTSRQKWRLQTTPQNRQRRMSSLNRRKQKTQMTTMRCWMTRR